MNNIDQELYEECRALMPVVELLKIKASPNSLIALEREQKLAIMGFSPSQIEEMTGQPSTPFTFPESSKESRLRFYGQEIYDKMEAYNAGIDGEAEQKLKDNSAN